MNKASITTNRRWWIVKTMEIADEIAKAADTKIDAAKLKLEAVKEAMGLLDGNSLNGSASE